VGAYLIANYPEVLGFKGTIWEHCTAVAKPAVQHKPERLAPSVIHDNASKRSHCC
jgi:hypothetical protein